MGEPHLQKPDWDNLGKAVSDAPDRTLSTGRTRRGRGGASHREVLDFRRMLAVQTQDAR